MPPAGPGVGSLPGASASIALIRRNKPGDADAVLGVGSNAAERPAEPRQNHARSETIAGRGSTKASTARSARSVSGRT